MKIYYERVDAGLNSTQLHEAAYALLHRVLETEYHLQNYIIEKTPAGKPYVQGEPVQISISHTKGLVCCAVGDVPLGVDCEYPREASENVMRRVCTEKELCDIRRSEDPAARFMLYWTLKESISKKRGIGMRESFRQYEIEFADGKPVCGNHVLQIQRVDGFFLAAAE